MSNDLEQDVIDAAKRFAKSQGAEHADVVSAVDMLAPGALGAHYAVAILARWPTAVQPRLRAFIAIHQGGRWWFLSLSDMWLQLVAEEAYKQMNQKEGSK
jgi:hypothetical protein